MTLPDEVVELEDKMTAKEQPVKKPKMRKLDMKNDEFWDIAAELGCYHSIFGKFWQIGKISFVDNIPTACIAFDDKNMKPRFYFNPDFWESLDEYSRTFIICHEMLHVVLDHGNRSLNLGPEGAKKKLANPEAVANIAMDIVVNHMLVNNFGFSREAVQNQEKLCWVDTVFLEGFDGGEVPEVADDLNFEQYFTMLRNNAQESPSGGKGKKGKGGGSGCAGEGTGEPQLADDHSMFNPGEGEEAPFDQKDSGFEDIIDELDGMLTPEDKDSIKEMIEEHGNQGQGGSKGGKQAGKGNGGKWTFPAFMEEKVIVKRKWETVIQKWMRQHIKPENKGVERWGHLPRRLAGIRKLQKDIHLPCEIDMEALKVEEDMIDVWFFLDTSGSCYGLEERFWKAAKSLPVDKFKVHLYTFNDGVYPVDEETKKMNIGGGTSFSIIERAIQDEIDEKYPEAVFIITDGYGNRVSPEFPARWHWFLTPGGSTSYIPDDSLTFDLEDYE